MNGNGVQLLPLAPFPFFRMPIPGTVVELYDDQRGTIESVQGRFITCRFFDKQNKARRYRLYASDYGVETLF